jgi:hypothetical protein
LMIAWLLDCSEPLSLLSCCKEKEEGEWFTIKFLFADILCYDWSDDIRVALQNKFEASFVVCLFVVVICDWTLEATQVNHVSYRYTLRPRRDAWHVEGAKHIQTSTHQPNNNNDDSKRERERADRRMDFAVIYQVRGCHIWWKYSETGTTIACGGYMYTTDQTTDDEENDVVLV